MVRIDQLVPVRKRIFIGLLSAGILCAGLILAGIWYLALNPYRTFWDQVLLWGLAGVLLGGIVIAAFGIGGMVVTIMYAKDITVLHGPMHMAINIFFPVALALGRFFNIDKDKIKSSFIEVNNYLVSLKALKLFPEQILLLVPHCLQKSSCPHKITTNINNCHRCGGCVVNDLLELSDKYGVKVEIATGGTLARKYVQEYCPRAIVAVACERDLTSGIQDAGFIPVLGITNERPFGPCCNTCVKVSVVEEAIRFFLKDADRAA
jgi:hypothetical protein